MTNETPTTLAEALDRIVELETQLAAYITAPEAPWRRLHRALQVRPSAAVMLYRLSLCRPGEGLSLDEIDAAVPQDFSNGMRKDPEFRTRNTVKQFVYHTRKRHPWIFEPPGPRYGGIILSKQGRTVIDSLLNASDVRTTPRWANRKAL
jgi:hypothetical protein